MASSERPPGGTPPALLLCFGLALVGPSMLAWNLPPSATLLNQVLALLGWGWVAVASALFAVRGVPSTAPAEAPRLAWGVPLVLAVLGGAALLAPYTHGLPWSLALSSAGLLAAAGVVHRAGATALPARPGSPGAEAGGLRGASFRAFCWALLLAGVLSVGISAVQFFAPDAADGDWIARTGLAGRAVGNLRQPNHLSSLLLWSAVAAWWLMEAGALRRALGGLLFVAMLAGVVMSASRTGMVGVLLLALWGALDRRPSAASRGLLLAAPLLYLLVWLALSFWAHAGGHVFGAEGRLTAEGDLSSSRFAIWKNTLSLIASHPWLGVGYGRFNFAWTLTPFPDRPVAFFDHTHNLPLQFAVELGLPLALLLMGALGAALWGAWAVSRRREGEDVVEGHARRAAFVMVLLMALHSQLEYPLWYAHFLLPTAWLFGWCLAARDAGVPAPRHAPGLAGAHRVLMVAGALVVAGGLLVVADYRRAVLIFEPPADAAPLAERIADGKRSWFFAHHAAYAEVTTAARPGEVIGTFRDATFFLLDTRLMMAWARAEAERGELDRARHLAARTREFRNPQSAEFFAPCEAQPVAGTALPFQCEAPTRRLDEREFP